MKRILCILLTAISFISAFSFAFAEEEGVPMHRLYNRNSGEHFYTSSSNESTYLQQRGWLYEGIGWYAPETSSTPVYRLYNKYAGDHHYTANEKEKDWLVNLGWNYEGIGWYSDDNKTVPLYRQYNPNATTGTHNYTTNKAENDSLVKAGWREEGIAWYGIKEGVIVAYEDDKKEEDKKSDGRNIDPNKPMLALTFDDGPSTYTKKIADLAEQYGGRVTFFFVGSRLNNYKDTVKHVHSRGHEIGNHTWDHLNLKNNSYSTGLQSIKKTNSKLIEITGEPATWIRPPYGSYNDNVRKMSRELKIPLCNWNVDTLDWKSKNATKVYNAVMSGAKDGAIILMHDIHKSTYEATLKIIPALVKKGYQLVTLTELMEYSGKEIKLGYIYGYNK